MHCPSCSFDDTKVIDSRLSEEGGAIRRRRSCTQCGYRFTTYERLEEVALNVLKRGGGKQPFDRRKMMAGIQAAVKGRPVGDEMIMEIAERIEDALRLEGGDVTSNQVGRAVLEQLRLMMRQTSNANLRYLKSTQVLRAFSFCFACSAKTKSLLLQECATT